MKILNPFKGGGVSFNLSPADATKHGLKTKKLKQKYLPHEK